MDFTDRQKVSLASDVGSTPSRLSSASRKPPNASVQSPRRSCSLQLLPGYTGMQLKRVPRIQELNCTTGLASNIRSGVHDSSRGWQIETLQACYILTETQLSACRGILPPRQASTVLSLNDGWTILFLPEDQPDNCSLER